MAEIQLPGSQTGALPADLPTDWGWEQIVPPNGADIGMPERYGYNYLMQQVNKVQQVANAAGVSLEDVYASLANKVDVGTPQAYDIPLINGFERVTSCIFFKIPNGLAVATFRVKLRNWEAIPAGDYIIAELPPGFRTKYLYHESGIAAGSSATVGLTMRGGGLIGMGTTQAVPAGGGASFAGTLVYLATE